MASVYISVDIEGVTGLVSWSQCGGPRGEHFDYAFARRMMVHDLNAAIHGARAAGATRIVIKDSHNNSKNLLIDQLDGPVELVSGHGAGTDGMMQGIDDSFDAALLIGYHAMAGTMGGVMEHTITGGIHRVFMNGLEIGEMGLSAGVAGMYGVPVVAASSDEAGCQEISGLISGVATASVKTGLGRYMAQLKSPSVTFGEISDAVQRGMAAKPSPWTMDWPIELRMEFNRAEEADFCVKHPLVHRLDGYTIGGEFSTFAEAHRVVWNMVALSGNGIRSQD